MKRPMIQPMLQPMQYIAGHALRSPLLSWRHHGIGVLQAYLHEGDTETRLHIWHPTLVLKGFNETNGLIHDHRFDFTSYVLWGSIYNEEFEFEEDPVEGEWIKYRVTHARKAFEETGSFNQPLGAIDKHYPHTARRMGTWHQAGSVYHMQAREFHMTLVNDLAVTMVVKTGLTDGTAVIVGKKDVPLIHAFDHPSTDYTSLLYLASDKLLGRAFAGSNTPPLMNY